MITFELGDPVRVVGLPNSELHGLRGRIVHVHSMQEGQSMRTECAVEIPGKGTRWFLAHHLLKSVPEKWIRFFRYEVLDRWNQLSLDAVSSLHGDRDELVVLLQDHYYFTSRRAQSEVDDFFCEFETRIASAAAAPHGKDGTEKRACSAA